ncbi:MAG TPA: hypothetical protein VIY52_29145 [Streptosporangiaceae bacterium]
MIRVDIACDLMDEDETGHVWAFGLPGSYPASGHAGLTALPVQPIALSLAGLGNRAEKMISQIPPNTETAPILRVG